MKHDTAVGPSPRLRLLPLAIGLVVFVGNFFLHLPISDICDAARARWGFPIYDRITMIGIPSLTLAVILPLLWLRRARLRDVRAWCTCVSLAVMTLAAQRWMLVANVELIHFPQFGLLAGLLLAAGIGAEPAWLLATLAGILDETYQHLVIYAGRTDTYLDFNDMILNAIGAAWVVCLFAPYASTSPRWWRWPWAMAWLLPTIVLAAIIAPPIFTPFLSPIFLLGYYRVIGLTEALVWASLLWGLVAMTTSPREHES